MIIIMEQDEQHKKDGQQLAALYPPPQTAVFSPICFGNAAPTRVSFLGHASATHFGCTTNFQGYTPEQFVDTLVKVCKLPESVKVIDLLGCETGFTKNGTSYAERVAKRFAELKRNVAVNAFSNAEYKGPELSSMYLSVLPNGEVRISACTKANQPKLSSLENQEVLINQQRHSYDQSRRGELTKLASLPSEIANLQQSVFSNPLSNVLEIERRELQARINDAYQVRLNVNNPFSENPRTQFDLDLANHFVSTQ